VHVLALAVRIVVVAAVVLMVSAGQATAAADVPAATSDTPVSLATPSATTAEKLMHAGCSGGACNGQAAPDEDCRGVAGACGSGLLVADVAPATPGGPRSLPQTIASIDLPPGIHPNANVPPPRR
jgi:hypothetical protein